MIGVPQGDELPDVSAGVPGPASAALCEVLSRVESPALTARRARRAERTGTPHDPIVWSAACRAVVRDVDGNTYVDMTAGFGAALTGYQRPEVTDAVGRQLVRLSHALGDVHPSDTKIALEARLASMAPWPDARVILGLSGSDAVEAALKTAMLATRRPGVVAFEGGYHGLGHGPLALCGYSSAFRAPFEQQLNPHVTFVPYPAELPGRSVRDVVRAAHAALSQAEIGAFVFEPILGRGGVVVPNAHALADICRFARSRGVAVVADEIYTGLARTSDAWVTSTPLEPDIVVLGKALGGTLPVSACLLRSEIAAAWGDPDGEAIHTSTFLGNPLACAAALAQLAVLGSPSFRTQRAQTVERFWRVLRPLAADPPSAVRGIDGAGLLAGVHLDGGMARTLVVVRRLLERGYVTLPGTVAGTGGGLVLTPSAVVTGLQLEHFGEALIDVLRSVAG